jgi:hypothetical protein
MNIIVLDLSVTSVTIYEDVQITPTDGGDVSELIENWLVTNTDHHLSNCDWMSSEEEILVTTKSLPTRKIAFVDSINCPERGERHNVTITFGDITLGSIQRHPNGNFRIHLREIRVRARKGWGHAMFMMEWASLEEAELFIKNLYLHIQDEDFPYLSVQEYYLKAIKEIK